MGKIYALPILPEGTEMTEHAATIVAVVMAALCLGLAFVAGSLHLSPRVTSPLSGAGTVAVSTVLILLASMFLAWGLLHLGFPPAR